MDFSTYFKFANRESIDFPIVGMAFQTSPEKKEYRLAFTAVDRRPVRGQKVESFLNGQTLTPEVVEEAAQLASKEATPVKNSLYAPSYKRNLMGRSCFEACPRTYERMKGVKQMKTVIELSYQRRHATNPGFPE